MTAYHWHKTPGWDPARVELPATSRTTSEAVRAAARETGRRRTEAKAAKLAEFARLITEDGLTVQEAGQRLGYGPKTAETYWREIKRQQREAAQL